MRDKQDRYTIDHADRLPAIFPTFDAVVHDDGKRIGKRTPSKLESHAVFAPIRSSLYLIPFEGAVHTALLLH